MTREVAGREKHERWRRQDVVVSPCTGRPWRTPTPAGPRCPGPCTSAAADTLKSPCERWKDSSIYTQKSTFRLPKGRGAKSGFRNKPRSKLTFSRPCTKSFSLAIIHFFEWFLSSLPSFQCWSLIFTFFLFEVTFTNLTIFVPSPVIVHWQVTRSLLTLLDISAVIYIPLAWIYCPVLHPLLTPDPSIPLKVNCDFLILPATWDFPLPQALFSPSWWTKTPPGTTRPRSNTLGTHFKSNSEHKSAHGSEELSRWCPTPLRKRIWFLLAPQNYSQNNVRGDPE